MSGSKTCESSQPVLYRVFTLVLFPFWLLSVAATLTLCRWFKLSFSAVQHSLYRWALKEERTTGGKGNDELYPSIWQLKLPAQFQRLLFALAHALVGNRLPADWRSRQATLFSGMGDRLRLDLHFSDCLTRWLLASTKREHNLKQIAFLGGGFDLRPSKLSMSTELQNTKVFEVDMGPTQLAKQDALKAAGLSSDVQFITADFTDEKWFRQSLLANGFKEEPTFFVAQGVVPLLGCAEVRLLLRKLSSHCPGSRICFDVLRNGVNFDLMECVTRALAQEPVRFRLGESQQETIPASEKLLRDCGWRLKDSIVMGDGAILLAETAN